MKLFGILIVVNSLVITGYWVSDEHQHKAWIVSVCVIALFVGIIFTMHDRALEITFDKVGTIKAAAEQATSDANEIAEIKQRIEAQSATVDLIAQKANTTVDQLHNIAVTSAEATITDLFGPTFLKTRLALYDRVILSLKEIGITDEKIKTVNKTWIKGVGLIYHIGICAALEGRTVPHIVNTDASPELLRATRELQNLRDIEKWEAPSPDVIEVFIKEKGFMNDKAKELLEDYRHFIKTGEIRRREVFEALE